MVAISLYRGNLHKVPDVPRKWLAPPPSLSAKDFKILLHRRNKALARLHSTSPINPNHESQILDDNQAQAQSQSQSQAHNQTTQVNDINRLLNLDDDRKELDGGDVQIDGPEVIELNLGDDEIKGVDENPSSQMNGKEERKREIEEKLKILNAKKHELVQSLKQILNAEEQLKRRSSEQGMAIQPPVSLQVDVTFDSGSRHLTPRIGSDGILRDGEGREAYDASNHNIHPRNYLRMSSVSPSSDSPHRRPFHSAVPPVSRATLGPSASPSRFAPTGQQGNSASLPTVSLSGTNYIASSPSPAASGGTSVFKDGRHVSPWK